MEADRSEAIVLGCTIIAACYERAVLSGAEAGDVAIINPNVMAVKVAELFADLRAVGQYRISRTGYYQQHEQHDPAEAREVLDVYLGTAAVEGAAT